MQHQDEPAVRIMHALDDRFDITPCGGEVVRFFRRMIDSQGLVRAKIAARALRNKAARAKKPGAFVLWAVRHSYPIWMSDTDYDRLKQVTRIPRQAWDEGHVPESYGEPGDCRARLQALGSCLPSLRPS